MKPLLRLSALLPLLAAAAPASAATSYDSCTGFITAVPVVISGQGTWCLKQDLATPIGSGAAVTVANHNVTIDCNGFKLGGLAAGMGTQTVGVLSEGRLNTAVRGCRIRGFLTGVKLVGGGAGHLVEDNVIEASTHTAVDIAGDGSVFRRNRVLDTGGSTVYQYSALALKLEGAVDVLDNDISDVASYAADAGWDSYNTYGILAGTGRNVVIAGNRIRGLRSGTSGVPIAIQMSGTSRSQISHNFIAGPGYTATLCNTGKVAVWGNHIVEMTNVTVGCIDGGNFVVAP